MRSKNSRHRGQPVLITARSIFWFVLLIGFVACNSSKYTPLDYPKDSISFGFSGGISNISTEYCLLDNGQLFKKMGKEQFESLKKIDSKQNKQIFNNIEFLGLNTLELKDPGNKTSYIRFNGEEGSRELAWGGNQIKPSQDLLIFYASLMNLVKKENK